MVRLRKTTSNWSLVPRYLYETVTAELDLLGARFVGILSRKMTLEWVELSGMYHIWLFPMCCTVVHSSSDDLTSGSS
jgi:hypothetical protein